MRRPPVRLTRRGRVLLAVAVLAGVVGALWLGVRVAATIVSSDRLTGPAALVVDSSNPVADLPIGG